MEDPWQPDRRRQQSNKRTFEQMATQTFRNSPSPQVFSDSISSRDSPSIFLPPPLQRRLSHPHNIPPRHRAVPSMSERPRQSQRPHLEHRTSQTIIDLTEDADDVFVRASPSLVMQRSARSSRVNTPPSGAAVIDLTDDPAEDDIQIMGATVLHHARHRSRPNDRHDRHHHHHQHDPIHALLHEPPRADSPFFVPEAVQQRRNLPIVGRLVASIGRIGLVYNRSPEANPQDPDEQQIFQNLIRLPDQMNYANRAFGGVPVPRPDNKPEHIPPTPAAEGFTTSPQEDSIIICPGCEQELVTNEADEPYVKGKGKSKKDRAEHPFWVVKACGHVYCNNCYQNRKSLKQHHVPAFFPNGTADPNGGKTKMKPVCAVEDCRGPIDSTTTWVGVYL